MKEYTLTITDLSKNEVVNTLDVDELNVLKTYYCAKNGYGSRSSYCRAYTRPYSEDSMYGHITELTVKYDIDGKPRFKYFYEAKYDGERRN